jgi:plastocyanin
MNDPRWRAVVAAGMVLAGLTAGHAAAAPPAQVAVGIRQFAYTPAALRIRAGTTVTWVNYDEEPHTVTAATGEFRSERLLRDDRFTRTFTRPGRYEYFCALHPHMRAIVIVD